MTFYETIKYTFSREWICRGNLVPRGRRPGGKDDFVRNVRAGSLPVYVYV